ncbi:Gamma-tubulin complex component 2 [Sesamum alatum]|uniref:Gamma-tubulin complex component 2 n=1 Tax=Sesamum alatum TaxID=300844 RepID=A0AAE1XX73_9LAMI|nr:Gamma-tubulin complex component 2 [Sesamum alatum]
MAVQSSTSVMDSLLEKLRLDDPWVPPRSWDSLPSEAGASSQPSSNSNPALYTTSTVSEPSLVRLAMNALQGVESALISIEKLSALLHYSSADRTSNRIPSLWTRCSSTAAVGNILTSIGQFGCIIFLLQRFVNYFTTPDFGGARQLDDNEKSDSCEEGKYPLHNLTLINQAFAISVGKIIDGYKSALNTLPASVSLRRFSKTNDGGCLTSIGHSEITLLEVYLHTTGLRTQIEALGNLCNVNHLTVGFPVSSLENLKTKADSEFSAFPKSGALLSFLYAQLKVADPDHSALLKFLFVQSYEPYSDFIRSWIFDGSISDPYHEFIVECVDELSVYASGASGVAPASPLPTIRVRDGAAIPCFLEECLVPLCRTGQQLQVILKLLELSSSVGASDTLEEILPCLVGLSNEHLWFAFPLTFDKGTIETLVPMRASYYQQMLEKIENILTKFDFSFRQATSESASLRLVNNFGKNPNHEASSVEDESMNPPPTNSKNQKTPDSMVDTEGSSITDEYSYAEDLSESSECSSSESSEDQNEADKLVFASRSVEPSYLSALDFSSNVSNDNTMQNLYTSEISYPVEYLPFKIKSGCAAYHKENYPVSSEQKISQTPQTPVASTEQDLCVFDGHHIARGKRSTWLHSPDHVLELSMGNCGLPNTDLDVYEHASKVNTSNKNQVLLENSLQKLKYDSTFFSMNPTLNRGSFFGARTMLSKRGPANYKYSYFDFTSVKDPLKAFAVKVASDHGPKIRTELSVITETPADGIDTCNHLDIEGYGDSTIENNAKMCPVSSPLHEMGSSKEHLLLPNISGGSTWESMLARSGNIVNRSIRDHRTKLMAGSDLPLDFVIKKCVLDEILLQYKYLSKLTIKLLIEGYKLQEHLRALRCYHFMELADWADLFIMSLWRRKWHVNEVDKRIPEIQGVLELAVQRSSCEGDPNKDRLYVYLKGEGVTHLSASAMGIHSFDFLGLGYRIDWPVSIILTPDALKIYSDIFNFLIQVKLAVFSLSDVWCSLKCYRLEQHKGEVHQISIITETRHKINHFVSTLQQYVQSQLSQVSWYRFLHSLEHKVQDMLDLESVHMAYLTESLHICFLSNETRPIAGIIQNILQCAMDFRSCLTGSILGAGSSDENLTNIFSQMDISQVNIIRRAFTKNLEELYLIYLQSPKHGEFGLPRFWDFLNYNDYYTGVMSKQIGHCIFYS